MTKRFFCALLAALFALAVVAPTPAHAQTVQSVKGLLANIPYGVVCGDTCSAYASPSSTDQCKPQLYYSKFMGRQPDLVGVYAEIPLTTWASWTSNVTNYNCPASGYNGAIMVSFQTILWDDSTQWQTPVDCAANSDGTNGNTITTHANFLVDQLAGFGWKTVYFRPNWEYNGGWYTISPYSVALTGGTGTEGMVDVTVAAGAVTTMGYAARTTEHGRNYLLTDSVSPKNGTYSTQATATPTTLNGNGGPTANTITNGGSYTVRPGLGDWIKCWQVWVTALRAEAIVDGITAYIVWNPAAGIQQTGWDVGYPGDGYVDFVGMDLYNQVLSCGTPIACWPSYTSTNGYLGELAEFITATFNNTCNPGGSAPTTCDGITVNTGAAKPAIFGEWGAQVYTYAGAGPNGDDPYWCSQVIQWIASHNVAMVVHFDEEGSNYSSGAMPQCAALFRSALNH